MTHMIYEVKIHERAKHQNGVLRIFQFLQISLRKKLF